MELSSPRRIKSYYPYIYNKKMYYYVYVLYSLKDKMLYTGYTEDLNKRIKAHNEGKVLSTKQRRPLILIYWEGCLDQQDATRREKYLKSGSGKIY